MVERRYPSQTNLSILEEVVTRRICRLESLVLNEEGYAVLTRARELLNRLTEMREGMTEVRARTVALTEEERAELYRSVWRLDEDVDHIQCVGTKLCPHTAKHGVVPSNE